MYQSIDFSIHYKIGFSCLINKYFNLKLSELFRESDISYEPYLTAFLN